MSAHFQVWTNLAKFNDGTPQWHGTADSYAHAAEQAGRDLVVIGDGGNLVMPAMFYVLRTKDATATPRRFKVETRTVYVATEILPA